MRSKRHNLRAFVVRFTLAEREEDVCASCKFAHIVCGNGSATLARTIHVEHTLWLTRRGAMLFIKHITSLACVMRCLRATQINIKLARRKTRSNNQNNDSIYLLSLCLTSSADLFDKPRHFGEDASSSTLRVGIKVKYGSGDSL